MATDVPPCAALDLAVTGDVDGWQPRAVPSEASRSSATLQPDDKENDLKTVEIEEDRFRAETVIVDELKPKIESRVWEPLPQSVASSWAGCFHEGSQNQEVEQSIEQELVEDRSEVIYRGPGRIRACDFGFFLDERFGRHWRCRRQ